MRLFFDVTVEMHHPAISPGWIEIFNQTQIFADVDNYTMTAIPKDTGDFHYYLEQGGKIRVRVSNIKINSYEQIPGYGSLILGNLINSFQVFNNKLVWQVPLVNYLHDFVIVFLYPNCPVMLSFNVHCATQKFEENLNLNILYCRRGLSC